MRTPTYSIFPTEEHAQRVAAAQKKMEEYELDALVLTAKENVIYFSGIRTIGWNSKHRVLGVVIPRDPAKPVILVIPENLYDVAHESSWIEEVRPWGGWRRKDAVSDAVTALINGLVEMGADGGRIGMEMGYGHRLSMSQEDYRTFEAGLPDADLVNAGQLLWDLRMFKSPREIELMRKACDATTKAFETAFGAMRPGMTERELAGIILAELGLHTQELPGFVMIRSGQEKYGMVNVEPFEREFKPGDLVVVDIGANYHHYYSDFMRMACIGQPSAEQRRIFDAELASQKAGVALLKPGVELEKVFDACYDSLIDAGLAEHVPGMERIGHGVGLDVHEPPSIGRGTTAVAEVGMVLTVEPIFWDQPDHRIGNFALEDNILITEDGHEILSTFPKDLYIVE